MVGGMGVEEGPDKTNHDEGKISSQEGMWGEQG